MAEQNRELIESLRARQVPAVLGDAAEPAVLVQAHIARASVLVIATPDTIGVRQMIINARTLNPKIEVLVRSHNEAEARLIESECECRVFLGESELANAMTERVLARANVRGA